MTKPKTMKSIFTLFIFLFLITAANAQTVLRLEKIQIPECGCSVYVPKNSPAFEMSYSEDSSKVFTSESTTDDNYIFGTIVVKFKTPLGNDKATNEEMLIAYMDFLKSSFGITSSAGYGKGHTLEKYPDAIGAIDYWEDADKNQYKVKGWIDGNVLIFKFVMGTEEYHTYNVQEMFLDGVRFE